MGEIPFHRTHTQEKKQRPGNCVTFSILVYIFYIPLTAFFYHRHGPDGGFDRFNVFVYYIIMGIVHYEVYEVMHGKVLFIISFYIIISFLRDYLILEGICYLACIFFIFVSFCFLEYPLVYTILFQILKDPIFFSFSI